VGDALIDEIQGLARELKGVRVCQINATAAGGGVAELLGRQVPILRALGVDAEWHLIHGDPDFFALTKSFHNALCRVLIPGKIPWG
jgi:trehalose synthase